MILAQDTKLVMIGDSITDCGRQRPIGEGNEDSLGNGYVKLVNAHLKVMQPDKNIRVVNMGISGNTIRDLKSRWENDVLALLPDAVSIMIGINDVWRHFDSRLIKEVQVKIDEYEDTLQELIEKTLPHVKTIILFSPYYIEPNQNDAMRKMMDQYGKVVSKTAKKYDLPFIDTQKAFDDILNFYYPAELALDRVHPNMTGHLIIAKAFLDCIEA